MIDKVYVIVIQWHFAVYGLYIYMYVHAQDPRVSACIIDTPQSDIV